MTTALEQSDDIAQYADMQKSYYSQFGETIPIIVVVSYDFHEKFPYETNLLYEYGDIRNPIFSDFRSLRAIDICCGEGRMVRRMQKLFGKVDGVDISPTMLELARSK